MSREKRDLFVKVFEGKKQWEIEIWRKDVNEEWYDWANM